jgi:hypothetical protein
MLDDLLKIGGQSNPVGRQSKDQVIDPHARLLKA